VHAAQYRLGRTTLAGAPPVPESRIPKSALIYYEDRLSLGNWSFGGGDNLFKWRYLRPDLREKSVPQMASVPGPLLAQWLKEPHAFFFTHDNDFRWHDATAIFRKHAIDSLPGYTNELLSQGKHQEAFDVLDPLLRRSDLFPPAMAYHHHGVAAHLLKRYDAALGSFAKTIELDPKYMLAYFNRGFLYLDMGRRQEACQDYRRAADLDPKNEKVRKQVADTCR
jgi:tetratricopeptide (TPR) repeat protein